MNDRKMNGFLGIAAIIIGLIIAVPEPAESQKNTVSHLVRLTVAEAALLDIDNSSPLDLVVVPPALKNTLPAGEDRGTRILHYTTVNSAGSTRSICVSFGGSSSTPSGTCLKIAAIKVPDGCGKTAGEVTIAGTPKCIITDIPTCATGTGAQGAVLQYRFVIDEKSSVVGGSKAEMTLTYTITES
jgi:hypothetical protein